MKMNSRLVKGAAALALAALVALPLSASAVPGRGMSKTPKANANRSQVATARQAARMQMLTDRINKVLMKRASTFDAAASRISNRIERVAAMASTVASAGGDVTGVLAKLDSARTAIVTATAAEASAVEMFKAVPAATNKKAAFTAAKAQARTARAALSDARAFLRNAIMDLKVVVNGLAPVTP